MKKEISQFERQLFEDLIQGNYTGILNNCGLPQLGKAIERHTSIALASNTPLIHCTLIVKGILYDDDQTETNEV